MRKAAYYKRNDSYSRSYNAEMAEIQNRYPLTRAAKYLGLSLKAFKEGLRNSGITTSEWHHVGKYAARIDYWDVSESSKIVLSYSFWIGAMNKSNKRICKEYLAKIQETKLANEKQAA